MIRLLKALILIITIGLLTIIGLYFYITHNIPQIKTISDYRPNLATRIFSSDGKLIGEFFYERRYLTPYEKFPKHLIYAFLAAEDDRFFEHKGIDFLSIVRAFIKNIKARQVVQGGSTITQQVTKSLLLSPEKSVSRKIKEAILAYRLEKNLSKHEILYIYLNHIYLGHGAYGVGAASEVYFDKPVEDLSLAESALLAGLPQAPSRYSPIKHPDLARKRQLYVLRRMYEEGYISLEQMNMAEREVLHFIRKRPAIDASQYFTEYIGQLLIKRYGKERVYRGGLNVYTTLDLDLQIAANKAVDRGLRELDKREGFRGPIGAQHVDVLLDSVSTDKQAFKKGDIVKAIVISRNNTGYGLILIKEKASAYLSYENMAWASRILVNPATMETKRVSPESLLKKGDIIWVRLISMDKKTGKWDVALEQEPLVQGALLAMDIHSGYVKVMVGGRDFNKSQFNRAIQARRQPGSAFKPIIYAAALDSGFTPATVIIDAPVVLPTPGKDTPWKPKNYKGTFFGPTRLRTALEHSINLVTIKVLEKVGVKKVIQYARRLGIESHLSPNLSLALGSSGVSLLELVRAYAAFGNGGYKVEPIFITRIEDSYGNLIEENTPKLTPALSPQTAYLVTSLLEGVIKRGTGRRLRVLKRAIAGKTGTTNDLKDAWFVGFSPFTAVGVWVGFDDLKPLGKKETGSRAAAPIWLYFMQKALKREPKEDFKIPNGIVFARIDPKTGLLSPPGSKNAFFECFKEGTAPKRYSIEGSAKDEDFLF